MIAGRELDALVAEKVMGWTKATLHDEVSGPEQYWCSGKVAHVLVDSWTPSAFIHYAWKVVEKLAKDGKHLALQAPGSTDMNECYRTFPKWTADFEFRLDSEAEADTAPLAICLAALKAVGVEVE